MHIPRKPGEQIEVDWAGDPAYMTDPDTGEATPVHIFVGVLSYSQYPYVEAFLNEQQAAWITAHVFICLSTLEASPGFWFPTTVRLR